MKRLKHRIVRTLRALNPLPEDVALIAEMLTTEQRLIDRLNYRIERIEHLLAGEEGPPAGLPPDLRVLVGTTAERLTPASSEFLNWATGHKGYAAQAGLWFNPPVYVEHRPGSVVAVQMNERVVEIPFALSATSDLDKGSKVVDIGATESLLAISLASLGFDVTAIDPRPYPLAHPRLTVVTASIESWSPDPHSLDAVFCISTLEHLGLGAYEQPEASDSRADLGAMRLFRQWLRPGGLLVLTVPYGSWSKTNFQRTYDGEHLDELLRDWDVRELHLCARSSRLVWEIVQDDPPSGAVAVALVKARAQ